MYFSQLFAPTLRETPAEAEVISHQLLVKAGFIRKSSSGVYTYLPLAWRVLRKIMEIVREEMNAVGGQELMLPIIQSAEIWLESGRWHVYGAELFRLQDRHERDFCLGPTHEELITDLVRSNVSSYRQLPLYLYQIQNKYRDERRPRFGLMRGREFIMKDLYSFDRDAKGLAQTYQKMYDAYVRIFQRCGLSFRVVEADSGAIGGSTSHEFMVLAETGEAEIVYCGACDYAANVEIAPCLPEQNEGEAEKPQEKIATPGKTTVKEVADFFAVSPKKLIKTLFYQADEALIAVLVRGDRKINEIKLKKCSKALNLTMATAEKIKEITGCPPGFVGPLNLAEVTIYADEEIRTMQNAVCGANELGYHFHNVWPERDFVIDHYADLRMCEAGEPCPHCQANLIKKQGIEVGQVFQLGTKYSEALEAKYNDETGEEKLMVMGCYGIGVSRTMAAAVEQNYDADGLLWPVALAPYHVIIIPISWSDELLRSAAQELSLKLREEGIEVVLDERDERAGVKFKDADLIGYPLRITVGRKYKEERKFEVKLRKASDLKFVEEEKIVEVIQDILQAEMKN